MDGISTPVKENMLPESASDSIASPIAQKKLTSFSLQIPRWVQILLACFAVISILSFAVWYGSKRYYLVKPLNVYIGGGQDKSTLSGATSSLTQNQSSSTTKNTSPDYDLSSFVISETVCYFNPITDQNNKLSTTTLSNLRDEVCALIKNQGKVSIKQPTKIIFSDGEPLDMGIVTSSGYTYLIYFSINDDGKGSYALILNSINLLKVATVSKIGQETIKNEAGESAVIKVSGTDESGKEIQQYFRQVNLRHSNTTFTEIIKNSDGTFSEPLSYIVDSDVVRVNVLTPYSTYSSRLFADIDSFVDSSKNTITAYHKAGCGLENAYSDMSFNLADFSTTIGINFGFSPTLNITTTRTGYDPSQWGKILEKFSMADFRASVQKPKALNSNSPVEMLTIGGYQVKHVGPITSDRSCHPSDENTTYDIYQAVKNGAVVTFTVFNISGARDNLDEIQKLISQVLTTLTFSKK